MKAAFESAALMWWPEVDLKRKGKGKGYSSSATQLLWEGWCLAKGMDPEASE